MQALTDIQTAPLGRLSDLQIEDELRGFPDSAVDAAKLLRHGYRDTDVETCLLGILSFYLPAGAEEMPDQLKSDTRLREDLGLDSLSLAEAMFKIEELFEIRVENAELAEVITLADARCLLLEKLAANS